MFDQRIQKAQQLLTEHHLDALILTNPLNIYYLSGFKGIVPQEREVTALLTKDKLYLYIPFMYREAFEMIPKSDNIEGAYIDKSAFFAKPSQACKKGWQVGVEAADMTYAEFLECQEQCVAALVASDDLILSCRMHKDPQELAYIKEAVRITDVAFNAILPSLRPGCSEKQIAKKLWEIMEANGAEDVAFTTIVSFGKNSSLPHYMTGDAILEEGIVLIDMGAKYKGYCADMTRTVYVGKPDQLFIDRYNLVLQTEQKSIQKTKAGISCSELHNYAVSLLGTEAPYFLHSLGHCVGLDVHEPPVVRATSHDVLPKNDLVTIEPGLYYAGWGGIRIEDYCLITKDGCETLSTSPRSLITLDI